MKERKNIIKKKKINKEYIKIKRLKTEKRTGSDTEYTLDTVSYHVHDTLIFLGDTIGRL